VTKIDGSRGRGGRGDAKAGQGAGHARVRAARRCAPAVRFATHFDGDGAGDGRRRGVSVDRLRRASFPREVGRVGGGVPVRPLLTASGGLSSPVPGEEGRRPFVWSARCGVCLSAEAPPALRAQLYGGPVEIGAAGGCSRTLFPRNGGGQTGGAGQERACTAPAARVPTCSRHLVRTTGRIRGPSTTPSPSHLRGHLRPTTPLRRPSSASPRPLALLRNPHYA
jgi:hypothetical protein